MLRRHDERVTFPMVWIDGRYVGWWEHHVDDRDAALAEFLLSPPTLCLLCPKPASWAVEGELSGAGKYCFVIQPSCDDHVNEPSELTRKGQGGVVAVVREGVWVLVGRSG
jgi:hypothetical protein